jgi:hypothetical protein
LSFWPIFSSKYFVLHPNDQSWSRFSFGFIGQLVYIRTLPRYLVLICWSASVVLWV